MRKEFIDKVKYYEIVDTRKYRYVFKDDCDINRIRIERLPISALDTVDAINNWEIVWRLKNARG